MLISSQLHMGHKWNLKLSMYGACELHFASSHEPTYFSFSFIFGLFFLLIVFCVTVSGSIISFHCCVRSNAFGVVHFYSFIHMLHCFSSLFFFSYKRIHGNDNKHKITNEHQLNERAKKKENTEKFNNKVRQSKHVRIKFRSRRG